MLGGHREIMPSKKKSSSNQQLPLSIGQASRIEKERLGFHQYLFFSGRWQDLRCLNTRA